MFYAITVTFADPAGDNDVLLEALATINARRLGRLGGIDWIAETPHPLETVRAHLLTHSRDGDAIVVEALGATAPARLRLPDAGPALPAASRPAAKKASA